MKKIKLILIILLMVGSLMYANNLENIYGRNNISLNNSTENMFGNNFGTILEYDYIKPGFIDIEAANAEIEKLTAENGTFNLEIEKHRTVIDESTLKKTEIRRLFTRIDLLLVDLKSASAELYSLKNSKADSAMRQKLNISIEENRQQIYDLNNKKRDLTMTLEQLNRKIEVSERFVTVNSLFIRRNNRKVSYLNNCIDFTNHDSTSFTAAIEKSTSFQNDVDTILNVTF